MMTRRSGQWTLCKYLLALPAAVLLALVFAEPQVTMAGDVTTMGAAAPMAQEHAQPQQRGGPSATDTEKKDAELALKAKIKDLKAQHAATNDPEKKKDIEKKIAQLQHRDATQPAKLDLNDPAAVQKTLTELTKKFDMLKAKSRDGLSADDKEKFQQELDNLSKKREFLKQRLAELQGSK